MFLRVIALTALFFAFAGFVQGAGVLNSPPRVSVALNERPSVAAVRDLVARPPLVQTFWRPRRSTAQPPEPVLRERIWNPYAARHGGVAAGA